MKKNKKKSPESPDFPNDEDIRIEEMEKGEDSPAEEADLPVDEGGDDLEFLKNENKKLKEDFLRAFADAENMKKRCAQELEKNSKYAISSFAKSLLSVADNLHRAIDAVNNDDSSENCKALLEGVRLTEAELMKVFAKFGISKMDIMGKVFDPNFHQVIQEVEDPSKPNGTVIAELQTGYMINDRILREAMVVVTKGGK